MTYINNIDLLKPFLTEIHPKAWLFVPATLNGQIQVLLFIHFLFSFINLYLTILKNFKLHIQTYLQFSTHHSNLFSVILNEADSTINPDLDVTISYSNSDSNNQSYGHGNSGGLGAPFVLFSDDSDSDTSSLNSGPLFREDDYTTSDSDTEQPNENSDNNIDCHPINKNKSKVDHNDKSHGNHQFWHNIRLLTEKVLNFQLFFPKIYILYNIYTYIYMHLVYLIVGTNNCK